MRIVYSLLQKKDELLNFGRKGIKVFMFHQVSDDKTSWHDENVSITFSAFKEFIDSIIGRGYKFIHIDQIEDALLSDCEKKAVITFDDGFRNVFDYAIPYLHEKQIPYTVFIVKNFIDKECYITKKDIEILKADPLCSIGFHTVTHNFMRGADEKQILFEADCKEFEEMYGIKIKHFAFPGGSRYACPKKCIKLLDGKYDFAFSTEKYQIDAKTFNKKRGFLPRINVFENNYKKLIKQYGE